MDPFGSSTTPPPAETPKINGGGADYSRIVTVSLGHALNPGGLRWRAAIEQGDRGFNILTPHHQSDGWQRMQPRINPRGINEMRVEGIPFASSTASARMASRSLGEAGELHRGRRCPLVRH